MQNTDVVTALNIGEGVDLFVQLSISLVDRSLLFTPIAVSPEQYHMKQCNIYSLVLHLWAHFNTLCGGVTNQKCCQ